MSECSVCVWYSVIVRVIVNSVSVVDVGLSKGLQTHNVKLPLGRY